MAFDQAVGLRISREPGAVPTMAQISEGELAFNLADGRIFARFGDTVQDITNQQRLDAIGTLANRDIHVAQRAPTAEDGADGDLWFQY